MTRLTPEDGIAVVTGAGSGLGRALARRLAAQGFTVAILGRSETALRDTARGHEDRMRVFAADVADTGAVDAVFRTLETEAPVALLINNAALYPRRDFLDESGDSFMATVAVNLGGVVNCSRAALTSMTARGRGRILNVSSYADLEPLPAASAYSVSKGAARILTRAMIADLSDRFPGIVIGDWMPGKLDTAMGVAGGLQPEDAAKFGVDLALRLDPSLNGAVFELDREVLPEQGLRARIKARLLGRGRAPRRL